MRAQDIVDRLSAEIPKYTDGFSDVLPLLSVEVSGTTATATTDGDHGLLDGQNVAVLGVEAPVQINVASFVRVGSTATFETEQDHDLTLSERDKANGGKTVRLSGANEAEFVGTFALLAVPARNKLVIAVADAGPTTISGAPLVDNANGGVFNGLHAATVTGSDTFTYELPYAYPLDGVADGATVQVSLRILSVLDFGQYLRDIYTRKTVGDDTLVVQLGDVAQSKSRNEQTDASTSSVGENAYQVTLIQPFAVYIVMNSTETLAGAELRDKVESEYIPAIFHSILRAKFDTGFANNTYRATFTGHGVFAYSDENGKNKAIYAHEVTFEQLAQVTKADTVGPDDSVALRDICYGLPLSTGTTELEGNVNLDDDAEPTV